MKHRRLGSTGLQVSEIVFGCGNVGGALCTADPADGLPAVRRALEAGIDWFDTAPIYGQGRSETNLGRILDELESDARISTKVMLGEDDLADIPRALERSAEASLARLRRSSVELIQLHNPVFRSRRRSGGTLGLSLDDVLGRAGVVSGFASLVDRGLTRLTGFTGRGDTRCLLELVERGGFQTVQAYYNLLNPSAGMRVPNGFDAHDYGRLIDAAREKGLGVFAIRVLAAGVLAGGGLPDDSVPMSPGSELPKERRRAEAVRRSLDLTPPELYTLAVHFALEKNGVSACVIGFSEPAHVGAAAEAAAHAAHGTEPRVPESSARRLEQLYAAEPFRT